jgi:hypothetical protein
MDEYTTLFWLPIILAIIAALPGIFAYSTARQKVKDERDATALAAWQELLDPLRSQVARQHEAEKLYNETISKQAKRIHDLENYVNVLERDKEASSRLVTAYLAQLLDNGIAPNATYVEQTRRGNDSANN